MSSARILLLTIIIINSFSLIVIQTELASPTYEKESKTNNSLLLGSNDDNTGFIENNGQINNLEIKYYFNSERMFIGFLNEKIYFKLFSSNNRLSYNFNITFFGSKLSFPTGQIIRSYHSHYYSKDKIIQNINSWKEIWYYDIYQNIDLRFYFSTTGLKYEFWVKPGGDPNEIAIDVSNNVNLVLDDDSASIYTQNNLKTLLFKDQDLLVLQKDKEIPSKYILLNQRENRYGIELMEFNHSDTLIIDPYWIEQNISLIGNWGNGKWDSNGNFYSVEHSLNSFQLSKELIIRKFKQKGELEFETNFNTSNGLLKLIDFDFDNNGNIIIFTITNSSSLTTIEPIQASYGGNWDIFLIKLSGTTGKIIFSTYFGGSKEDRIPFGEVINDNGSESYGSSLTHFQYAFDSEGSIYIQVITESNDLIVKNAFLSSFQNQSGESSYNGNLFYLKINPVGELVYSTYFGPHTWNNMNGNFPWIKVSNGNLIIAGITNSTLLPVTVNAFNSSLNGNSSDLFLAILDPFGNAIYSTYFGGSLNELLKETDLISTPDMLLKIDFDGKIILVAKTKSMDFPLLNAFQTTKVGYSDITISKFDLNGDLLFSSYLGGQEKEDFFLSEEFLDLEITKHRFTNKNMYTLVGRTTADDFPLVNAFQTTKKIGGDFPNYDLFISTFNDAGSLIGSTILGGRFGEWFQCKGILDLKCSSSLTRVEKEYIIFGGRTGSYDFPVTNNALEPTSVTEASIDHGNSFVTIYDPTIGNIIYNSFITNNKDDINLEIIQDNTGNLYIYGETNSEKLPLINNLEVNHQFNISLGHLWAHEYGGMFLLKFKPFVSTDYDLSTFLRGIKENKLNDHYYENWLFPLRYRGENFVFFEIDNQNQLNMIQQTITNSSLEQSEFSWGNYEYRNIKLKNYLITLSNSSDNVKPEINLINVVKKNKSIVVESDIELSVTDDLSGVSKILYSWNGNTNNTLLNDERIPIPNKTGEHTLKIFVQDKAGNWNSEEYLIEVKASSGSFPIAELLTLLGIAGIVVFISILRFTRYWMVLKKRVKQLDHYDLKGEELTSYVSNAKKHIEDKDEKDKKG